jgi:hypothetical protein
MCFLQMEAAEMPRFQIVFHQDGWLQLSARRMRPDFTQGQIHRWRLRFGPVEIRGWRNFQEAALS